LTGLASKIALVGRLLQSAEGARGDVALDAELTALVTNLALIAGAKDRKITFNVSADAGWLPTRDGRTVLLIAHELIINALKHGFGAEGGQMDVVYRREGLHHRLVVESAAIGPMPIALGDVSVCAGAEILARLSR
jgi:two-component sensor histidine kinase